MVLSKSLLNRSIQWNKHLDMKETELWTSEMDRHR